MVQVVDATKAFGSTSPSVAPTLASRCEVGVGECSRQCNDDCCQQKCYDAYPLLNPKAYCSNIGLPQRLCTCAHDCPSPM